jgi:hypothetical protein
VGTTIVEAAEAKRMAHEQLVQQEHVRKWRE